MRKKVILLVLFVFIILLNSCVYATNNIENVIIDDSIYNNVVSSEIESNITENAETLSNTTSYDFNVINENLIKIDKDIQFIISFFCLLAVLILFILLYKFFSWFFPI